MTLQQAEKIASALVDNFGGGSAPASEVALAKLEVNEDPPKPKRRTWCWCNVYARRQETIWRRERERKEREGDVRGGE